MLVQFCGANMLFASKHMSQKNKKMQIKEQPK